MSEDRVATGIEGFDDLIQEGIPRGAKLPGGDNNIHVVGFESHRPAKSWVRKKTRALEVEKVKLTATTESCAKPRCHRCFRDSHGAYLSLGPMHSLPSQSRRSSR